MASLASTVSPGDVITIEIDGSVMLNSKYIVLKHFNESGISLA
jgi:hypothetical protein